MAHLSNLIIQHPECNSFEDLRQLVVQAAREGEIFMHFDVRPDYRDTPRDWYMRLEAAFYTYVSSADKAGD